jgi:D-alanine-D-alanine ligase
VPKLKIALISGGISVEREVSKNSGNQVYEALDKAKYDIIRYDPESELLQLVADSPKIDFALIILHGHCGEDGTIQGLLDLLDIPYQGSGVLGSAVAMNKFTSKQLYEKSGIPVPPYIVIKKGDPVEYKICKKRLGNQLIVKPVSGGSSIGISIVKSNEEFIDALKAAFSCDDTVLVETFIKGIEITGGIIGNDELETLPIVEIIPDKNFKFFDYTAKYEKGATKEICPAEIDDDLAQKAKTYAKMAHEALFCRGYSRTDMILSGKDIYVLETNTIPGMTATSLLPLAAKAADISFPQLLDKLIELGLEEHRKIKDKKAGK